MMRSNISDAARRSQTGTSRATIRDFDDKHMMQEVKQADVFHSETPSDFERWQMVGLTAVPMKQDDSQQAQQKPKQKNGGGGGNLDGDFNHDQPQGDAAEAVMMYLNGSRSHPVAIVDDRRVRPHSMKPGESALYAASGTGQLFYHNDAASYVVTCNTESHGEQQQAKRETRAAQQKERFASVRHVEKDKQKKPQDQQAQQQAAGQQEEFKHEGKTVNAEVKVEKTKITTVVYDQPTGDTRAAQGIEKARTILDRLGNIAHTAKKDILSTVTSHIFDALGGNRTISAGGQTQFSASKHARIGDTMRQGNTYTSGTEHAADHVAGGGASVSGSGSGTWNASGSSGTVSLLAVAQQLAALASSSSDTNAAQNAQITALQSENGAQASQITDLQNRVTALETALGIASEGKNKFTGTVNIDGDLKISGESYKPGGGEWAFGTIDSVAIEGS